MSLHQAVRGALAALDVRQQSLLALLPGLLPELLLGLLPAPAAAWGGGSQLQPQPSPDWKADCCPSAQKVPRASTSSNPVCVSAPNWLSNGDLSETAAFEPRWLLAPCLLPAALPCEDQPRGLGDWLRDLGWFFQAPRVSAPATQQHIQKTSALDTSVSVATT